MKLYQRIKDLREDEDLTQMQIVKKFEMNKTTYCRYEQGKSSIPFNFIVELAKYYKVSIDYIAGLTNDKGGLHKNNKLEQKLLNDFNNLSDLRKGRVLQLIEILTDEQAEENANRKERA